MTDEPYRITGWLAVAAPSGTPKAVVARVAKEIGAALQLPDVREKVVAMGFEIEDSSPEKFQMAYRKEMPVWERLVKQTGARLD
ncbi:Tripartite tricarboxylate transporter family receptor [compost metagenome]